MLYGLFVCNLVAENILNLFINSEEDRRTPPQIKGFQYYRLIMKKIRSYN